MAVYPVRLLLFLGKLALLHKQPEGDGFGSDATLRTTAQALPFPGRPAPQPNNRI